VLRICTPNWRAESDLKAELAWLNALAHVADINAPVVQPTRDGGFISIGSTPGVPGDRRCILMSWISGANLGVRLSEPNLVKMGHLFARLHTHTACWDPPETFSARKMDRVLARDEPELLSSFLDSGSISSSIVDIWVQTQSLVEGAYVDLYARPGIQVIHHDLWHDNIKIYRGRLSPLDFEDTAWGYPVQDIAMAMQDLMQDVSPVQFDSFQSAFRDGYERLKSWPEAYEAEIDRFRAGRMLWVANYVARHEGEHLPAYMERQAPMLARFLDSGRLRKLAVEQ
jgi:Ser/Thr protein kinase RdoA (MazF antagonist)